MDPVEQDGEDLSREKACGLYLSDTAYRLF